MSDSSAHSACDRGMAACRNTQDRSAIPHAGLILATSILASSLAFIDGSVINVGLRTIGASLHADGGHLSWIVDGYLLPLSALLLIGGAAGDRFGRRRVLILGVALFAIASVLCAAATSLGMLLAGRIVQGVGAAMLMPNSLSILGNTFTGEARGRAIGIWAGVGAGAGALGPLIGGWLVDHVGWRSIFFVNIPIALATITLAWRYVPANDDDADHAPLDLAGAALAALSLGLATWALITASAARGFDLASGAALAASVIGLAGFVAVERRRGEAAMMPLTLFTSRSFAGLTLLTVLLYGALGGLLVLIPFVLTEQRGYTATMAGAALLPLPLMIALGSSFMGRIAARIGPRLPLTVGPLIVAMGLALAARIGTDGSYWVTTLPAILLVSIGMAGTAAPLTTAVLGSVDARHTGVASGFNSAVARTGGLIATALLSGVLAASGSEMLPLFRLAAFTGAGMALASAACAFLLLQKR